MDRAQLEALKQLPATVACGDCRACCKQDRIVLGPRDNLLALSWHFEGRDHVLDRKPNGECVYLRSSGCSIHASAPDICKRFDCRVLFATTPKARRRIRIEENPTMREVYDAGKRRLDTLEIK